MSKKIKRSIAVVLGMVCAFAMLGCGSGASGGAEEAIARYFKACNDMDMEAIHAASYPAGMNGSLSERLLQEGDYNFYMLWRDQLGFSRSKFDMADWAKFDPNFIVLEDFPVAYEGENGEMQTRDGDRLTIEEVFPDFAVEYTIEEMEHFGDCEVYARDGLSLIDRDNMDEIVGVDGYGWLDVDDMYVAQLKVEWSYKGNPYGYNRHWWKDENFTKLSAVGNYEDLVAEQADREYIVFVYKYDGEWYVYPESLRVATILYTAEF